jgi:ParB-like chromosome segregation protein Spo0J
MRDLSIEYRPVTSLLPSIRNRRTHRDAQVAQIAARIRAFGWTNPIPADGENGIIAGHGRWRAAQPLEFNVVSCIERAHLTPAQRRACLIADNRRAEQCPVPPFSVLNARARRWQARKRATMEGAKTAWPASIDFFQNPAGKACRRRQCK